MNKKDIMLCESITKDKLEFYDSENYKANIKYDGCRVIAVKKGTDLFLFGRSGEIYNDKFKEVFNELKDLGQDFIIDGEIISTDNNFNKLQQRVLTKNKAKIEQLQKLIPIKYMVFDVLYWNGEDLRQQKLKDRLTYLFAFIGLTYFRHIEMCVYDDIFNMLQIAIENDGEGIVIKDMNSTYEGKRSKSWLKYKLFKEGSLRVDKYSINPKGIRATDEKDNALQIAGKNGEIVKELIDNLGYCDINIQYLSESDEGRKRFISFRGVKND